MERKENELLYPDRFSYVEDIYQFWILSELLTYYTNILTIIITLGVSSFNKLKRRKPKPNNE